MDVPVEEVEEQIRRITWELRISHDSLLKAAEALPSRLRERAQSAAGTLTKFCEPLRELSAKLPAEGLVPASINEYVDKVHLGIAETLREVDLLIEDVRELLEELYEGDMQGSKIN